MKATSSLRQQIFVVLYFHLTACKNCIYLPLELVDGGGIVLERLRARQSLYTQIAVHTVFFMFLVCRVKFSIMDESFLCHFSFSLFATPSSNRISSLFNSQTVWNSPPSCRRSSALNGDPTLCLLAFLLCALLRFLNKVLNTFFQYQKKYAISCALTLLKLLVRRAPHSGIRTFIKIDFAGSRNLQYYHIWIFSLWSSVVF